MTTQSKDFLAGLEFVRVLEDAEISSEGINAILEAGYTPENGTAQEIADAIEELEENAMTIDVLLSFFENFGGHVSGIEGNCPIETLWPEQDCYNDLYESLHGKSSAGLTEEEMTRFVIDCELKGDVVSDGKRGVLWRTGAY